MQHFSLRNVKVKAKITIKYDFYVIVIMMINIRHEINSQFLFQLTKLVAVVRKKLKVHCGAALWIPLFHLLRIAKLSYIVQVINDSNMETSHVVVQRNYIHSNVETIGDSSTNSITVTKVGGGGGGGGTCMTTRGKSHRKGDHKTKPT